MKRKDLEQLLEDVEGFERPKILLEQYETSPHIAACMLHAIESSYGEISGKTVLDLGCGCGMLSIGASLLGAAFVLSVDIDKDALAIANENIENLEITNVSLIQSNVLQLRDLLKDFSFDTVIMNPPFGTKHNKGLDWRFVEVALECVKPKGSVYSLHKSSTRSFFAKKAPAYKAEPKVIAELRYNLPSTYKFHTKASVDIEVDFWRFMRKE
nr:EOG090X0BVL [Eulimnadia texana]